MLILPGAGDYESALRMMGESNAIDAFAAGRERNLRMQGELQRQALQREASGQRADEINRRNAMEIAGLSDEDLAGMLAGQATGTTRSRGRSAAGTSGGLDYDAATLQEALAADQAEAVATESQRMRELDSAQMALAKELPAEAALAGEARLAAARGSLLGDAPSYTSSRGIQAELEGAGAVSQVQEAVQQLRLKQAAQGARDVDLDLGATRDGWTGAVPGTSREEMLQRLELGGVPFDQVQAAIDRIEAEEGLSLEQGDVGAQVELSPGYAAEAAGGAYPMQAVAGSPGGAVGALIPGMDSGDVAYQRLKELQGVGAMGYAVDALRGKPAAPAEAVPTAEAPGSPLERAVAAASGTYTAQAGDTVTGIARKLGISYKQLEDANRDLFYPPEGGDGRRPGEPAQAQGFPQALDRYGRAKAWRGA